MYQQTRLSDLVAIGAPGPIPYCVENWHDAELADLDAMKLDPQFGLSGMGVWPVVVSPATADPTKQVLADGLTGLTVDAPNKRWTATQAVRALTAAEIATALASTRTAQASAVDAKRDAVLAGGFPYDFGGAAGAQVLQTRDQDATNWLTLQSTCLAAVTAGQGTSQGVTIRTLANVNVSLTYADGLKAMLALAAWGAAVYANSWALKDKISAAADQTALVAIDVSHGWPPNP